MHCSLRHMGYTPFDLVHGFRARTPLDALYHSIVEVTRGELKVCAWVEQVAERVELLREAAALGTAKAKEGGTSNTANSEFAVGDKVLYRVPGLCDKLAESWEGPFEVVGKRGDVNYKIRREG